ncbi:MAG: AmmeMemoRadiSam system protein A [Bacillota bacterium]
MELTDKEKRILLNAARETIKSFFSGRRLTQVNYDEFPAVMKANAGAFVTLTKKGSLRGCIGFIESENYLYETVCDAALRAAFSDPRFYPLEERELEKVEIEISVLSPPFKMNSYDDIQLGVHGLILEDLGRRALLLPQVPIEHNMTKEMYLSAICEKAGLPPLLWKERELKMNLFTATVFSEEEIRSQEYADN